MDPQDFLPSLFEQLRQDLGSSDIKALTEQEIEIWKTPEGTLYNDGKNRIFVQEGFVQVF